MLPNDNELIAIYVKRDDASALEQLVRRHSTMVLRVCRHMLWREEDAEDAFQAVFVLLAAKSPKLLKHESIAGWLHVTATRVSMKLRRQLAKKREIEMLEEPAKRTEPWEAIAERRDRELLHHEIARLPKNYRDVIVLYHFEGKSRSQIADVLNCTTIAVKALLSRARKTLRKRLIRHGISASIGLAACMAARDSEAAANDELIQSTLEHCLGQAPTGDVGSGTGLETLLAKESVMAFGLKSLSVAASCALMVAFVSFAAIAAGPDDEKGDAAVDDVLEFAVERESGGEPPATGVEVDGVEVEQVQQLKRELALEASAEVEVNGRVVAAARRAAAAPRSNSATSLRYLHLQTVRSNGKRFRYQSRTLKPVMQEQTYTVSIPENKDGKVVMRTEQRTRMVNVMKAEQKDALLDTDAILETVSGEKLDHDAVASKHADREVVMVVLSTKAKISPEWKQVLRPDAIVIRDDELAATGYAPVPWGMPVEQARPAGLRPVQNVEFPLQEFPGAPRPLARPAQPAAVDRAPAKRPANPDPFR